MLEQKYVTSDLTLDKFYDLSVYADALKNVINENPNDSFYQDMKTYFLENNTEYPNFATLYGNSFWEGVACH
jgi:NitT/TauT family transport system substrate-binding protein